MTHWHRCSNRNVSMKNQWVLGSPTNSSSCCSRHHGRNSLAGSTMYCKQQTNTILDYSWDHTCQCIHFLLDKLHSIGHCLNSNVLQSTRTTSRYHVSHVELVGSFVCGFEISSVALPIHRWSWLAGFSPCNLQGSKFPNYSTNHLNLWSCKQLFHYSISCGACCLKFQMAQNV